MRTDIAVSLVLVWLEYKAQNGREGAKMSSNTTARYNAFTGLAAFYLDLEFWN